ncbi:MAG: RHS domain-containing protein [Veillonella sp.]|nr:RHS domain-containing protein [Veillonella sp.]
MLLRQPRRESRQQTHYFHHDQIGIPREMTDKDGSTLKAWQFSQYPLLPLN